MKLKLLFIAVVVAAICGCSDGAQQGRFVVFGDSSFSIAEVPGSLTIVRGDPLPLNANSTGDQPLLYILAIAPSLTSSGGGSTSDNGVYVSTFKNTWQTPQGEKTIELSWDRRTDAISVGEHAFDRQQGNAFILIRDASGSISATQVGPLDAGLDELVVLTQIQAALSDDSPAKSVTLSR